jgi:hypothetical protein
VLLPVVVVVVLVAVVVVAAVLVVLVAPVAVLLLLLRLALPEPKSSRFTNLLRFNTRCAYGTTGVFFSVRRRYCRAGFATKR